MNTYTFTHDKLDNGAITKIVMYKNGIKNKIIKFKQDERLIINWLAEYNQPWKQRRVNNKGQLIERLYA